MATSIGSNDLFWSIVVGRGLWIAVSLPLSVSWRRRTGPVVFA
jgi:hypothetical protein